MNSKVKINFKAAAIDEILRRNGESQEALAKDVYVNGYVRRDGTYVPPHYRSAPDHNPYNNYSAYPNVNPYTGQQGTISPNQTVPRYRLPNMFRDHDDDD